MTSQWDRVYGDHEAGSGDGPSSVKAFNAATARLQMDERTASCHAHLTAHLTAPSEHGRRWVTQGAVSGQERGEPH